MRYRVKKIRAVSRILAMLFCIALLSAELNMSDNDRNPGQSYFSSAGTISEGYHHHREAGSIAAVPGVLEDEVVGEILSGAGNRFSFRVLPLKYILVRTFFLFIPLVLWSIRTVLLQSGYISRMFLIRYIHDSDGEKGEAAGI
ncbi:hypothetical protein [Clostridium sp. Marseille-P2415]|uniref:hypothetical protein n=1 Tax=Clostridium sp. Marseille-P2415 TaxID=1805471 RepID=UPI00098879CB|nr:hypothetical protein [Clostridium sp. Marseille-P2415]